MVQIGDVAEHEFRDRRDAVDGNVQGNHSRALETEGLDCRRADAFSPAPGITKTWIRQQEKKKAHGNLEASPIGLPDSYIDQTLPQRIPPKHA